MKKNLTTYIKETNKAFAEATPAEQRVIIAKDVILRLETKNLLAAKGAFLKEGSFDVLNLYTSRISLKNYLNKNDRNSCVVCAKGALFCSIIGRNNKMTIGAMVNGNGGNNLYSGGHQRLLEYFSREQLDLIETAFEGKSYLNICNAKTLQGAIYFYNANLESHYNRLVAICNNIIENQGTFKP